MKMAQISSGGEDRIDKVAGILAAYFHEDPLYTYILHDLAEHERKAFLPKLLRGVVAACVLNGGSIIEVGDWSACGVFMPPGRKPDNVNTLVRAGITSLIWNLGISSAKRLIIEYPAAVDQVIAGVLDKEEIQAGYWYGIIMCTSPGNRQKGLASSLVSYVQDLARIDGRPMWIEAPSEKTAQLYLKLGFEHAGKIIAGRGVVGMDGLAKKGGEGITAWGMIYRPGKKERQLSRL
ncbi:putative acyl- N-acyltransferase [Rosellinia necatrix]|uniref:Putative acyl-N-acyltransferase n=1 Tax=Rosellinia necatrix TaxID=77044 RepID=A0A1W2TCE3_ROSNE|nr:putative acyl- N-acyltransferase [Rosellinia necatrix]